MAYVKATAPGYHNGPRAVGDVFEVPDSMVKLDKDGNVKSKWLVLADEPADVKQAKASKAKKDKPEGQKPAGQADAAALA